MALLLFSTKCNHSMEIIEFMNKEPQLKSVVRVHDVGINGIPDHLRGHVKSVPTLVTNKNQILVGKEVRNWLESLIPPAELANCNLRSYGGNCSMSDFGGNDNDTGDYFDLSDYGKSLQPAMTPEMQERISKKVT